jgi:hypothetical protein
MISRSPNAPFGATRRCGAGTNFGGLCEGRNAWPVGECIADDPLDPGTRFAGQRHARHSNTFVRTDHQRLDELDVLDEILISRLTSKSVSLPTRISTEAI